MVYFYRRAGDSRSCETRLEAEGAGYELIVTEGLDSEKERFEEADDLFDRASEVRHSWWANGWREVDPLDEIDELTETD
jgi:hypothetical protein